MKLQEAIEQYIKYKRSLGRRYDSTARRLRAFCNAMGDVDVADIQPDAVKSFIFGVGPVTTYLHSKNTAVRSLFGYLLSRGYVSQSPLPAEIPKLPRQFIPHIYTLDELRRILEAAETQPQCCHLETHTFRTLVLLLYGAALRLSEALRLTLADIDLDANVLTIRDTKFFKTRWVPISTDLRRALDTYLRIRTERKHPAAPEAFLLLTSGSQPVSIQLAELSFKRLREIAGVRRTDKCRYGPRLHDLRHSFAVHRLIACYREGGDVGRLLLALSTFLGHADLLFTQRYLTLTPELLRLSSDRFEKYALTGGRS